MRKKVYNILTIVTVMLALSFTASCTLETSGNGDLDGYWHLVRVDTLATGGTCDMSEELVFWAIQGKLLNTADRSTSSNGFIMRFNAEDGCLSVYDIHTHDRANGDVKVEDPVVLSPFGINALEEKFVIESLSSKRMTLSTEVLRLSFYKL